MKTMKITLLLLLSLGLSGCWSSHAGSDENVKKDGVAAQEVKKPMTPKDDLRTLFDVAIDGRYPELVAELINKGANVNAWNQSTALAYAAKEGHLEVVQELIKHGADLTWDFTALRYAAQEGHLEIVEEFIKHGMDVQRGDYFGERETPLLVAASGGHLKVVRALIKGKADVNKATKDGFTPLHEAASNGHLEVVKELIKNGANVNRSFQYDLLPDSFLTRGMWLGKVDNPGSGPFTPIKSAARHGHLEVVKELIKHGADAKNPEVIRAAVMGNHPEIIEYLVKKEGVNVNTEVVVGATNKITVPLLLNAAASSLVEPKTIKCLLELGATSSSVRFSESVQTGTIKVMTSIVVYGDGERDTTYEDVPVYYKANETAHLLGAVQDHYSAKEKGEIGLKKTLLEEAMKKWDLEHLKKTWEIK